MPVEFKVKVGKMKNSLWMTIPIQIAEALELKAWDTLAVSITDHVIQARKKA